MKIINAHEIKRGQGPHGEYVIVGFQDETGQQYSSFAEVLLDVENGADVPGKTEINEKNGVKYYNFKPDKNVAPGTAAIPLKTPERQSPRFAPTPPKGDEVEGRVRHGLVVAMLGQDWEFDRIVDELPRYTQLVMTGKVVEDKPAKPEVELDDIPF